MSGQEGRPMTMREIMDAEDGGTTDELARLLWLSLAEMMVKNDLIIVNNVNDLIALAEYVGKWLRTGEYEGIK